jgi:thiamine biosynthesis protein ThiI
VNALIEIFVRYGELGLKSPPVRRRMEKRLAANIKIILEKIGFNHADVEINRAWARLIISLDIPQKLTEKESSIQKIVKAITQNVAGITSVSPVFRTSSNIVDLKKTALELAAKNLKPNSTFAVRTRRIGNHDYSSQELERLVGEVLFESLAEKHNLSVNLTNPDYTLSIEVKDDVAFVFDEKILGIGGLPQGTHGKIFAILRGSIEDAISGFLMSKRGSNIVPITFQLKESEIHGTNTNEIEKQLVTFNFLQPKKHFSYYKVDFIQILQEIGFERLQCSTCDKLCIAISEKIAKEQIIDGICLGNARTTILDRIPEKSSNILAPVYYPVISLDPAKIDHPYKENFSSEFCLAQCPGYKNQKKKEIKPPSPKEIERVVAEANFSLIKLDKD